MHLEYSIELGRSVGEVYDLVSNLENDSRWQKSVVDVIKLTHGPIGVGTRFVERIRLMGKVLPLEIEILEFRRHHSYVAHVAYGNLIFVTTVVVTATKTGARLAMLAEGKLTGLAKLAAVALSRHRSVQIEADLANLKLMMEAGSL